MTEREQQRQEVKQKLRGGGKGLLKENATVVSTRVGVWKCIQNSGGVFLLFYSFFKRCNKWEYLAPPPPSTRAMVLPVSTRARREKSVWRSAGFWNTRWYISLWKHKWHRNLNQSYTRNPCYIRKWLSHKKILSHHLSLGSDMHINTAANPTHCDGHYWKPFYYEFYWFWCRS